MTRTDYSWLLSVGLTILLLGLIALAAVELVSYFVVVMPVAIGLAAGVIYLVIPGSRFFSVALTNFLSIYTCLFMFFIEVNFWPLPAWIIYLGYVAPIASFFCAVMLQRGAIRAIVLTSARDERGPRTYSLRWLIPITAIGVASFFLPQMGLEVGGRSWAFLGAMAVIAAVVFWASLGVAKFLIDASIVFEAFSRRIAMLVVPAFAFFTFYSLLVIVFAGIYRVIDRFSDINHFLIGGIARDIRFTESLYFSLITLSTVGYGDITPESSAMRVIVSVQIVVGVVLMLFGFYEIMTYARERRG